jgi:DNA-directed RNA polymerase subunit K/omega
MDYSNFIENYNDENISLFEKTLLVIKRMEDIYSGKAVTFENKEHYKPLNSAIYEVNKGNIHADFSEKIEETEELFSGDEALMKDDLLSDDEDSKKLKELGKESDELLSQIKIDYDAEKE